jgi:signal transduction histidine kinase
MTSAENATTPGRPRALPASGVPEAGAAPEFDRIARLAGQMLRASSSFVAFVGDQGVWCKACTGSGTIWTPQAQAFSRAVIAGSGVSVIADATQNPRLAIRGPVSGPPGVRFYAGAPIVTSEGARVGAVCVLDGQARPGLTEGETAALIDIAAIAADLFGGRGRQLAALQARTAELTEVNRRARLGTWRFPVGDGNPTWSDEVFEIFGRPVQTPAPSCTAAIEWVHADDRVATHAAFVAAAEAQAHKTFEFRVVRPDGQLRYCLADVHPDRAPDGRLLAVKGFCQDVTERKETELTLLQSEKLRAVGQLTGGVAHDFNNLLTVVVLSLEEAIESLPSEDLLLDLLQPALDAAMRGYELTSQLLSYSRSSRLEPTQVDLEAFFARLLPLLRRSLGDRYSVEVRHQADVGQPFGDVAKLESAVMNLVINARDAMASGGTIVIETARVLLTATSAGFTDTVTPGPYVVISVSDTGCGISAGVLPRIFEPFFTTKPVGKGSGLGLSMMYGFVKQSGGHVTASSAVGVGTTVSLYLPMAPRSAGPVPASM